MLSELKKNPTKKLGQNFLIDEKVVNKIASSYIDLDNAPILEIGAGLGALSQQLLPLTDHLSLLELDQKLIGHLRGIFCEEQSVSVLYADALGFDYQQYTEKMQWAQYHIFGNIPYNITSDLVEKLLIYGGPWLTMTLLVQREAANRIVLAKGRDNGPLSLLAQYYAQPEILFQVSKSSFYPVPSVDSAVMRLTRRLAAPVEGDKDELFALIKAGFSLRRKTLANALAASPISGDKSYWERGLDECGLLAAIRAEAMTLTDFSNLANWQKNNS